MGVESPSAGHVFAVADDGRIVVWDEALSGLTHRPSEKVRTGSCELTMQMWKATNATPLCYVGCPMLQAARCGQSECNRTLVWLSAQGGRPMLLTTVSVPTGGDQRGTVVHFLRPLPVLDQLTPQEVRVLAHLDQGASTQRIAEELRIRASTVRTHVRNLMAKLGAKSRLQAVSLLHL
jgi:DNA-binding CsgD family transcriptional regulator